MRAETRQLRFTRAEAGLASRRTGFTGNLHVRLTSVITQGAPGKNDIFRSRHAIAHEAQAVGGVWRSEDAPPSPRRRPDF
jgi:hypothetical protein